MTAAAAALLPLAVADARKTNRPQGMNVSYAQREIDWDLVRKSDLEFVFIRASRGLDGPDPYYRRNYQGARRKANLRAGPYHRAYPDGGGEKAQREDARDEARIFMKTVRRLQPGDLRPVLDLEIPFGGLDHKELIRWAKIWLDRVGRKFDTKPIIYTSYAMWEYFNQTKYFAKRGHKLWVAHFNVSKPAVPAKDWDKKGWTFWQKQHGNVQGVEGVVGKDVYRKKGFGPVTID